MQAISRRSFVSSAASALVVGSASLSAAQAFPRSHHRNTLSDRALTGLRRWFAAGGGALAGLPNSAYEARLDRELEVVARLGLEPLFFEAERCAAEGRACEFVVAPGYGATCNALLALALGVTTIDPLRHGLPFERFASLERSGTATCIVSVGIEPRGFRTLVSRVERTFGKAAVDFDPRGYGPAASFEIGPRMRLTVVSQPELVGLGPFLDDALKSRLDDPATIRLFANGDVGGVAHMTWPDPWEPALPPIRTLFRCVRPSTFEAIVATRAMFRGRNYESDRLEDFIALYFDRDPDAVGWKFGPAPPLRALLPETGGAFVYQEQVSTVVAQVTGQTLGAADAIRRAMIKRGGGERCFVDAAAANGMHPDDACCLYYWILWNALGTVSKGCAVAAGIVSWASALKKRRGGA
jgi:DNA polymerase III alpha subunit